MLVDIEYQVFVDLIRDGERIVLLAQARDEGKLFGRKDFARGVVGRIENNRASTLVEKRGKRVAVEAPIRGAQGDKTGDTAGHFRGGHVGVVVRLENDDFVAG